MINWLECSEIETVPGKMGGRPVVKGTRIEPETFVADHELGATADEIHESFPTVAVDTIRTILSFAQHKQLVA
jgi:uncharacterized protein (DUF433 family)